MLKPPKLLALILAGGKGSRLDVLTDTRAKPTLPFGGVYHLIDIPLSNLVHSGVSDVWVIEQYRPHGLNDHLSNGRPWDLDRSRGGLRVLPPYQSEGEDGFAAGNAAAIHQHLSFIEAFAPDLVLTLSSDHLYKLDYREVVAQHLTNNADLTLVTTQVDKEEATRFGVVTSDDKGRVSDFAYKPDEAESNEVTAEIFLYNAKVLTGTLRALAAENDELGDYGERLLPELVTKRRVYTYPHKGYWRDLGTPESYWQAHQDLLAETPEFSLDEPDWPLLTQGGARRPAHIFEGAVVNNSLLSPGCVVKGKVVNSVLAPGVVVEAGSQVSNAVILEDVTLKADAQVRYAVLDKEVVVGAGATIAGEEAKLSLVGAGVTIEAGKQVGAGARLEPDQAKRGLGL